MYQGRNIKGLKVITFNHGKKVGWVEDLLIDLEKGELKAIIIEKRSILKNAKYVDIGNIISFGRDAVIISGLDAVRDDLNDLVKMSWQNKVEKDVLSLAGTAMGTIQDILFEFPTGQIVGIEMSGGIWADLNQGRKMIPWHQVRAGNEDNLMVEVSDENLWI